MKALSTSTRMVLPVYLVPSLVLGAVALIFLFREARRLEEQNLYYRDNLARQLEERASSAVANMLLSLQEVQELLEEELANTPPLPNALTKLLNNNQLIREVYAWNQERGFWFPKDPPPPELAALPWTRTTDSAHASTHDIPNPITISPPSQNLVDKQITARRSLINLSRTQRYDIDMPSALELPSAIRSDSIQFDEPVRPLTPTPMTFTPLPAETPQSNPLPKPPILPTEPASLERMPVATVLQGTPMETTQTAPAPATEPVDDSPAPLPTFISSLSGWLWSDGNPPKWYGWVVKTPLPESISLGSSSEPTANPLQQETLIVKVDTEKLLQNLHSFVPQSELPSEQFYLSASARILPPNTSEKEWLYGSIPLGTLPNYRLFYQSEYPSAQLSPDMIRWIGTLLVLGILVFVVMAAVRMRRKLITVSLEAQHKATFLTNVSHELKSPLTTIQLYTEMLGSNRVQEEHRKQHYLTTIQQETERLGRLLDNLLNQNRLEREKLAVCVTQVDITELLTGFSDKIRPRLGQDDIILKLLLPRESLMAEADPDAVLQILTNLFDNAIKYAGSGKEISLEASRRTRGVCISVKDRGEGIPYGFRDRLFSPFERADNTLTNRRSGMGIGLSISRGQARAMGGDLVYTPRSGGGSTFSIILKPASLKS